MFGLDTLWQVAMVLFMIGGGVSLALRKHYHYANITGHTTLLIGSLCSMSVGIKALIQGEQVKLQFGWLPYSYFDLYIDGIGAFFISVISVVSLFVAIYAIGYTREYYGRHNIGWLAGLVNIFVLAMLVVTTANNAIVFLVAWELMSLVSYFLVVYEQKDAATRAGFIYFVMTHVGTAAVIILFLLLYSVSGTFQFDELRNNAAQISPLMRNILFLLALLGFGTKAGLVPVHVWLPVAHPAAPSHVSALMSGVMVKTAIYAFLRVIIPLSTDIPLWWGSLLIVIGLISALIGVMYALVERDTKRLLAYSTVENIGIIFTALGALFVFKYLNFQMGAVVAAAAMYLHIFNHAVFKGLLFMAAGAVVQVTYTRDMDRLGGIIRKMPQTAAAFFVGAAAISALPPLNGFVSEWMLFQSLFLLGIHAKDSYIGTLAPVAISLFGLVGALVAASFVKMFGAVFLAQPRHVDLTQVTEASLLMRSSMLALAGLCVVCGIFAAVILQYCDSAIFLVTGLHITFFIAGTTLVPQIALQLGALSPDGITMAIFVVSVLLLAADRMWGRYTHLRVDETWGCGIHLTSRMEYTGTSFSQPFKVIFRAIFLPERSIKREYVGLPYFTHIIRYHSSVTPVFEKFLYRPAGHFVMSITHQFRRIQTGRLQFYLGYIFATLIVLLLFAK
jgi:hydrogenase-4 component B